MYLNKQRGEEKQWVSMSLRTIGEPRHSQGRKSNNRKNYSLVTNDISGAKSATTKHYQLTKLKKYTSTLKHYEGTDGIIGAKPRQRIPKSVNKKSYIHRNDDIEGSTPIWRIRSKIKRRTNPLNPNYNLPKFVEKPVTPPKFIRDNINFYNSISQDDKPKLFEKQSRDKRNYYNFKSEEKKKFVKNYNSLNVKDINTDGVFISKRNTNPLSPRYVYDVPKQDQVSTGKKRWTIGKIDNKPKKQKKLRKDNPMLSLKCDDINLKHQQHRHHVPKNFPIVRRQFRKINKIDDIDGSKPCMHTSTFKIKSRRRTNPLDPVY